MAREQTSTSSSGTRRAVVVLMVALAVVAAVAPASAAVGLGTQSTSTLAVGNASANDAPVTLRGQVVQADSTANDASVSNGTLRLVATGENSAVVDTNQTDSAGRFVLADERNQSDSDQTYGLLFHANESENSTTPAAYSFGRVDASESPLNLTLPEASHLNVTVVAPNGTPVEDAPVRLTHAASGTNATVSGATNSAGRLVVNDTVGVQMAGDLSIAVESPDTALLSNQTTVSLAEGTDADLQVALPKNDTTAPTLHYEVRGANRSTDPPTANVSESVTFDARNSTDDTAVTATTWTFPNGTVSGAEIAHRFARPGNYSVGVVVADAAGNRNESTIPIRVVDRTAPTASFDFAQNESNDLADNSTVVVGESVQFDANGSADDHRIEEFRWDFDGDGSVDRTTANATVEHTYAERENVTVELTAVDPSGNSANSTRTISVEAPRPTANFTVSPDVPDIGETVTFDAAPTVAAGNVTNYTWTFDGATRVPNSRNATYEFSDSGTYEVTLRVTDEYGHSDSASKSVTVPNQLPRADAGENQTAEAGATLTLDGGYSIDPDDDLAYSWNQTGGPAVALSNESAVDPTFVAPNVGANQTLEFELTVSDDHGANDTDTVEIAVTPNGSVGFEYSPTAPAVNESAVFQTDDSAARWDFDGDGVVDSQNATATHAFDSPGTHEVELTATERNVSVVRTVTVYAPPTAAADAPANATAGEQVPLDATNATGAGDLEYEWTQTGGPSATLSNVKEPTASFVAPTVSKPTNLTFAVAVSGPGGNDSATVLVTVVPGAASGGKGSSGGNGGDAGGSGGSGSGGGGSGDGSAGGSGGGSGGATGGSSGGGGGSGSGGTGAPATGDDSGNSKSAKSVVSVERAESTPTRLVASVSNAGTERPANVSLADSLGGNHSFDSVSVAAERSKFSLSVRTPATRPTLVPAPSSETVLSYLSVTKRNVTNAAIEFARFRFHVPAEQLDQRKLSPADVRLYRYSGGRWQTLATTLVSKENGAYRFEALSPGFSVFAVGVARPPVDVVAASLKREQVAPGEDARVTARVTNRGSASRSVALALSVDDSTVAKRQVELSANSTRTVTFTTAFESPGQYELAVENASAGTLSVGSPGERGSSSGDESGGNGTNGSAGDSGGGDTESGQNGDGDGHRGGDSGDEQDEPDEQAGEDGTTGQNSSGFDFGAGGLYFASFLLALFAAMLWGYLLS